MEWCLEFSRRHEEPLINSFKDPQFLLSLSKESWVNGGSNSILLCNSIDRFVNLKE